MSTPALKRAVEKIKAAFADLAHPAEGEIACDCRSKSCEGLAMEAEFKPFTWQNVPDSLVDKYANSLPIFTDQGLQYFLPAYMLRALAAPDGDVWEAVILGLPGSAAGASLLPPDSVLPDQSLDLFQRVSILMQNEETERLRDFSIAQVEAMSEFVEYLIANPTNRTDELIEELFARSEFLGAFLDHGKSASQNDS